jgi:hypothetical protein
MVFLILMCFLEMACSPNKNKKKGGNAQFCERDGRPSEQVSPARSMVD